MLDVVAEVAETTLVAVSLVWVQVLKDDSRQAAQIAIDQIDHPGWRHFYDPQQIAAREMAYVISGCESYAWDTYLVFSAEAEWTEAPPQPSDWVHQLDHANWAPEHRRKKGPALFEALQKMIL